MLKTLCGKVRTVVALFPKYRGGFSHKYKLKKIENEIKCRHTKYKIKFCCVRFDRNKIALSNEYKKFPELPFSKFTFVSSWMGYK